MSMSNLSRRDFLWRTSLVALSSGVLIEHARGQSLNFVVAETNFGKIRGIENRGVKIFKGIPYGASTAGANRFMPPVDPAGWNGVREALEYGHSAPQNIPTSKSAAPKSASDPTPPGSKPLVGP